MLDRPDPNENLVKIFDTEHEAEAQVVKGLLESAGIDAALASIDVAQATFPASAVSFYACVRKTPRMPGGSSRNLSRPGRERTLDRRIAQGAR